MSARLTPYDNGTRLEPHVWVRGDVATPGGLPRRTEEDDYGRVDLDDDEGRTVLTLYVERTAEGFHARVVQHECDHLLGKLYPMRMRDFARFGFTEVLFPGLDAQDD